MRDEYEYSDVPCDVRLVMSYENMHLTETFSPENLLNGSYRIRFEKVGKEKTT